MAQFDSFGGGLARGAQTGLAIRESREIRQSDDQAQQAKIFREANDAARESAIANATRFGELAVEAAPNATPEQLAEFRRGAMGSLMTYAQSLEEYRALAENSGQDPDLIPSGKEFVQQHMELFDSAVESASIRAQSEKFEAVPPEEVEAAGLPKGTVAQRGPDNKIELLFEPSKDVSSLQERVELLKASGIEEERAMGIAAGRFKVSSNPITNEHVVLDVATGEQVGEPLEPPEPSTVPGLIPDDVDAGSATGLGGMITNTVNIIGDTIGLGTAHPKAQEATEALKSIQTLTTTTLQSEVPGRPSNFLLERLEGLTVAPNSLLQGEDRAKTRLEQTHRLIDGEIQRMEQEVLPLELPPDKRVETQLNLTQLKRLRTAYEDLISSFDEKAATSEEGDVDPEIQSLLDKYAPGRE